MKQGRASFSALGLAFDPKDSLGANVGNNPGEQTVAPGESRVYTYYADPFIGETASLVWDWGNVMTNPRNGLFGGIVIGPKGATYRDPKTGADISLKNSWVADVIVDRSIQGYENRQNYRDAALFFQDEDNIIGTSFMPYVQNTAGLTAVNYRSEPYKFRESTVAPWARSSSLARWTSRRALPRRSSKRMREIPCASMCSVQAMSRTACSASRSMSGPSSRSCAAPTRSASSSSPLRRRSMPSSRRPAEASASRVITSGAISGCPTPNQGSGD
jgi:hypothetical protein